MPFRIQRVPRPLNNLLSLFGGQTPVELEDRVRGVIDMLQMYAAPNRQVLNATNAALTEGTFLSVATPTVPYLLFGGTIQVAQTATMTALELQILVGIPNTGWAVASQEFTQFGATVTGTKALSWVAPYPWLLNANVGLSGLMTILGTDANANAGVAFDVCLLT